jgi:ABC-type xylose transport system permease subunit
MLHRRRFGVGRRRQGDGAVIGAFVMGVMNNGMSISASASITNR